jgi:NAD(P)-dependent dehydrogenase (short-subunit alcohol dehydrogenase family)
MLLQNQKAVIYGAGGAIGGAVARAFVRDGAKVFLAGRTVDSVRGLADELTREGGTAEAAQLDVLDEQAIEAHIGAVAAKAGGIDILFNAIGMEDVQGTPLLEMTVEDVLHPIITAARTQFLTARAVGRRMITQGYGVIMSVTAEPTPAQNMGGFMAACSVIEGLWRGFAAELGPHGVRLVVLRSAGSPDTPAVQEMARLHAEAAGVSFDEYTSDCGADTLLGRLPTLAEVANAATLFASDRASAMTGAIANVTCGAHVDL